LQDIYVKLGEIYRNYAPEQKPGEIPEISIADVAEYGNRDFEED
jgi:hypothetical protein